MKWEPKPYQLQAAVHAIERDACGLLLPPGAGKTSITLAVRQALASVHRTKGMLLIVPIRPLSLVWPKQIALWDDFRDTRYVALRGTPAQRIALLEKGDADIYAINPELTEWLCDWLRVTPVKKWPFDMLVIDESTKFKNPSSKRFKAIKPLLPKFKTRIILTGTPAPNGLLDLWSQVYTLDFGQRLGRFITHYQRTYFDDVAPRYADYSEWQPKMGAQQIIQKRVEDICMSLDMSKHIEMPPITFNSIAVTLPKEARAVYDSMERSYVAMMNDATVSAMQASSVRIKLRQITGGTVYGDHGVVATHTAKIDALLDLVDELSGDPLIVAVGFLHEVDAIRAALGKDKRTGAVVPYLGGGVSDKEADRTVEEWNAGRIPVLLAHPTSIATGLNLQAGGCTVCWFTLTDNREEYDQLNARVYRQGQTRPVVIHHIIADNTVDADVCTGLASKDRLQTSLLKALQLRMNT